ncbi:hypothetical protein Tco_0864016, partial [Tanacetum coccineum]
IDTHGPRPAKSLRWESSNDPRVIAELTVVLTTYGIGAILAATTFNQTLSATEILPDSSIGMWYKLLMAFFLSDMVQNAVAQALLTPLQRLPTTNQQHRSNKQASEYPSVEHQHVADEGHNPFSRTIVTDTDKPISSNNPGRKRKKENTVTVPNHGIYAAADTQTLCQEDSTTIFVDGSHHSRSAHNQGLVHKLTYETETDRKNYHPACINMTLDQDKQQADNFTCFDCVTPNNQGSASAYAIVDPSMVEFQSNCQRGKQRKDTKVPQPNGSTEPITDEAANAKHVPTHSNDPLFSGEDRLQLKELLELCTKLSKRVLDLENTKTSQAAEITKLKKRVKKLERSNKSRTPGIKRLRKVGRSAQVVSYEDEGLGTQEDASKQGRKIADLDANAEVVSTAEVTTASATTITIDELTLAQTLIEIKTAKAKAVTTVATTTTTAITRPKARGVVVQEPCEFRTTTSSSQTLQLPHGTDKAKIPRKRSKTGQTRTRERKSTQRAGRMLSSQPSVNPWSKSQQDKIQNSKSSP